MLRSRPSFGLIVGFLLPLVLVAPGCLRTLDESRINKKNGGPEAAAGSGGSGGSGGSAGADASAGGAGGQPDAGGAGGQPDAAAEADAGLDAPVDVRPEAGFTPYDQNHYPVSGLLGAPSPPARRLVAVDNSTVFATTLNDAHAGLSSVPLTGGSATTVTTATLSYPQDLIAPATSNSVFYVGVAPSDNGVIGRFLKNPSGANPEQQITTNNTFGRGAGIGAGAKNAYASVRATAISAPSLLKFSLAASATPPPAQVLLVSQKSSATGGPVTVTQDCVYWISNGGVWVAKKDGTSAIATSALHQQVTDAIDVASDASNFYYTRGTGEVWQRPLSGTACNGAGPDEKAIAWGYTNIGKVGVYGTTVVWTARGGASYTGGGIFTTDIGGYDVVQIAPPDKGVDDMAVGPNEIVYSTLDGSVHKVPKLPK